MIQFFCYILRCSNNDPSVIKELQLGTTRVCYKKTVYDNDFNYDIKLFIT